MKLERTWVTGSAHDDKVLDWLFDLRYAQTRSPIDDALKAVTVNNDATVGEWQTALLVSECVAYLRQAPADIHQDAREWLEKVQLELTQTLIEQTVQVLDLALAQSSLHQWWKQFRAARAEGFEAAVGYLRRRVLDGPDASSPEEA
jgi:hypothetical protein